jgi:hypothetical protein
MLRIALAVFLVTGAVNLQLPHYGLYAADAGFGSGAMALLLQGYTAALIGCLIAIGGISDARLLCGGDGHRTAGPRRALFRHCSLVPGLGRGLKHGK